ncbi:MAG: YCF48-related protein [Ignavibacteria bacterium]
MKNLFLLLISILSFLCNESNAQWISRNSGTSEKLTSIAVLDSFTAVAAGYGGALLKTTDAGETWINKRPLIRIVTSWNSVSFYDKNIGIAAGHGIMITEDGGENWMLKGPGNHTEFLCAANAHFYSTHKNYFFLGDDSGYVWQSVDTGKTWTSEKITDEPICSIFLHYNPVYHYPLCTVFVLTLESLYSKTELSSSSWQKRDLNYFYGLGSRAYAGTFSPRYNSGFIMGVRGDLLITPGALRIQYPDTIWKAITSIPSGAGALWSVSAPKDSIVYACGSMGVILKSTDNGDTWYLMQTSVSKLLCSIDFLNDKIGYAVGDSGTILFTNNGGVISGVEKDEFLPDDIFIEQNYPNPFNPSTTIKYSLNKSFYVKIAVYNLLGREIKKLLEGYQNSGAHSLVWDAADDRNNPVSSGVYFCRIEADKKIFLKKMILIR